MYLVFPPVIWAAVRFGRRGATGAILLVSAFTVAGTATGRGPFVREALSRGLVELQAFMAIVAVMTLLLSAAVRERDRARRQALDAVRARDDFLSIASHELRTPLASLVLQLGATRRRIADLEPGSSKLSEKLALAQRQSDRLTVLVGTLLDVSRIEGARLDLHTERVDLAEVVRDVAARFEEDASRVSSPIAISAPEKVEGDWDRLRLEQILTNLLSNALRHAPGTAIDIGLTSDDRTARLTVADGGKGIADEHLEAIFDRFHRGTRRREGGGLGLGLHVARHLAVAHGGRLFARRGPAGGAIFTLELPRDGAAAPKDDAPSSAGMDDPSSPGILGGDA